MTFVRDVARRFRVSEGRIKIATLSGVSVMVTAIALLVGVLPVFADHETSAVPPNEVDFGGGSGGCAFVGSAAGNELHINNPATGKFTGPDGTEISITVTGRVFAFTVENPGMAVYDVTVNGGSKSNHYDYDGLAGGPVTTDADLHAPLNPQDSPHNLSHVNICYDGGTQFECNEEVELRQEGLFTVATATIFANSLWDCNDKLGAFVVDNSGVPTVTLDFGEGEGTVAGLATFTKVFDDPGDFVALTYDRNTGTFVDIEWCELREKDTGDGTEFDDFFADDSLYPSLDGVKDSDGVDATACKAYEEENAEGIQFTLVYFEFDDPNFR